MFSPRAPIQKVLNPSSNPLENCEDGRSTHTDDARDTRGVYSRSPKNPALQLFQTSSKSVSTTPQGSIWNTFATVAVQESWENGCT